MTSAVYQAVGSPFRNQLGWLKIDGRRLAITIETTPADRRPALEVSLHKQIA